MQKCRAGLYPKIEPCSHKADAKPVPRADIVAIAAVPRARRETFKALAELIECGTEIGTATASLQMIPADPGPPTSGSTRRESHPRHLKKMPVASARGEGPLNRHGLTAIARGKKGGSLENIAAWA